jgi:hypothetical protein
MLRVSFFLRHVSPATPDGFASSFVYRQEGEARELMKYLLGST